jgi:hypothetical protein
VVIVRLAVVIVLVVGAQRSKSALTTRKGRGAVAGARRARPWA